MSAEESADEETEKKNIEVVEMMKSNAERIATYAKTPAVAAGGDAAGVENPREKGPEGDSDMAGGEKPVEGQEQKEDKRIQ